MFIFYNLISKIKNWLFFRKVKKSDYLKLIETQKYLEENPLVIPEEIFDEFDDDID